MPKDHALDRRGFMKTAALAGAAAGFAGRAGAELPPLMKRPGDDGLIHGHEAPGMTYRKLGRTNYMASRLVFGCGAALSGGKAVRLLDRALEAGVNFYDVGSNTYYRGAENHLGPFMKANRDAIWVSSKAPQKLVADHKDGDPLTVEQAQSIAAMWTKLLEASLKDLDTEYVDAYYIMACSDPSVVKAEEMYQAFLDAKAAGKVGHFGVSTHHNTTAVLEAMAETGWYDLAMMGITPAGWYDWNIHDLAEGTPPMAKLKPVFEKARAAGIGLIGMKSARYLSPAGGKDDPTLFDAHYTEAQMNSGLDGFQRSYAYVLANGVDVVNSDMQNFETLEANLKAVAASDTLFA